MSFAIDAKEKALNEVPSIVHVDNTCRVQTYQNENYYNLIYEFYKKTNVPMLLNTFNLAGFPIVENFETLEFTAKTSEFKNIYAPTTNLC